ncbi:hypothetical protein [Rhodococcus sp. BS-15]|uniref:hypothetical protein n=1 Tax=Rhodococcus sp. BS-15 TaxID=1304954 RepID=UPI000AF5100F|nr:hypothetical protein [Rhodococcus sp. BS-15]
MTERSILSGEVVKNGASNWELSCQEHKVPGNSGFTVWAALQLEDIPFLLGKTPEETARLFLETVNRNPAGDVTCWGRHF